VAVCVCMCVCLCVCCYRNGDMSRIYQLSSNRAFGYSSSPILVDLAAPFLRQWIKYRNVSRLSRLFGKLYDRWIAFDSAERNGADRFASRLTVSSANLAAEYRDSILPITGQNGVIIGSLSWNYRESRYRVACRIDLAKIRRTLFDIGFYRGELREFLRENRKRNGGFQG